MNNARNLVGCGIAIINDKNQILLQHRADSNTWGIPGGILEVGEATEDCARREIKEETNLTVGNMELLGAFSGKDMHWIYPDGNEFYFISISYVTRDYSGTLIPDGDETIALDFFAFDNLPEIIPTNTRIIEEARKWIINKD